MKHTIAPVRLTILALSMIVGIYAFAPAGARAQLASPELSYTQGLFVHARTGGYGIAYKNDQDASGGGLGVRLGYGFSDRFTLYAGMEGGEVSGPVDFESFAKGDEYGLGYLEVGGRFHFRPDHKLVPFADAAISMMGIVWEKNQTTNNKEIGYGGLGASVGGGVMYFFSPRFAIEGSAAFSPGNLMERDMAGASSDVDIAIAGVRLNVGVSFYPFR